MFRLKVSTGHTNFLFSLLADFIMQINTAIIIMSKYCCFYKQYLFYVLDFILHLFFFQSFYPAEIYLFKVTNKSIRPTCESCSKHSTLTLKTIARRHWCLLLLTLNRFRILFWCFHCWFRASKCWLDIGQITDVNFPVSEFPVKYLSSITFQDCITKYDETHNT